MSECIFCKIVKKQVPSDIVYEDEDIIAFKDINPGAPVHILIVPKVHISSLNELADTELAGKMILAAKKVAKMYNIDKSGYKLIVNTGEGAGQLVRHIHMHLLGGGDKSKWRIP